MDTTVLQQIDALNRMSMAELRKRWSDLFGAEPGQWGRPYLVRRLAYRIQELAYGGLSPGAKRRLSLIADGAPVAPSPPKANAKAGLLPGTVLIREWHGERHEVTVQDKGFMYQGRQYRSLTAIARTITGGSPWGGNRFFGLPPSSKRPRRSS